MQDELPHHIDEKALLLRIAEGDESAFRELYQLYGKLLFPFLVRLTGSEDIADEIIQEVFLRVWFSRDRLPAVDYPRAYIFRIASNRAYDWLKRNSQLPVQVHLLQPAEEPIQPEIAEAVLELKAMELVVKQAIAELPPQRMHIYRLSREQGMKPAQIAAELNLSVSTVKNTLVAAVRSIRERLEQAGYLTGILLILIKF
jgi:RNA polymerase sigma-70 factor (ECF subfamily)